MPLEVIESTDSLTDLIRFQTSTVYELIISLQLLNQPGRRATWTEAACADLPPDFLGELDQVYTPYVNGHLFMELPVDFDDHHDMAGFIDYVRAMPPERFLFYLVGRILSPAEIDALSMDAGAILAALDQSQYSDSCPCAQAPLADILADMPAFQNRLAHLWQWYWEDFFRDQLVSLRPHWQKGLDDKQNLLARAGGQHLYERVTGKTHLPVLPPDHPVTEIIFIPLYLIPSPVYMFYGYSNITVLFDSERTEARLAQIEQDKLTLLAIFKALGDNSRMDILRAIAHEEGKINGKRIAKKLNLSAPTVSRHLGQLKDAGLIAEESTDNRTLTYTLRRDLLSRLADKLMDFLWQ